MEPTELQRKLGKICADLLYHPSEAPMNVCNRELAGALEKIVPMWPLLAHHSCYFPWFTEELKRVKRCQEHHWRKTKNEFD